MDIPATGFLTNLKQTNIMKSKTTTTKAKTDNQETVETFTQSHLNMIQMLDTDIKNNNIKSDTVADLQITKEMAESANQLVSSNFFQLRFSLAVYKYTKRMKRRTSREPLSMEKTKKHFEELYQLAKILKM